MKRLIQFALASLMATTCLTAHAEHLTQQDCQGYPFVHASSPTHDQLVHELELLKHEGYQPGGADAIYPAAITRAQDKLQQDYQHDCLHQNAPSM